MWAPEACLLFIVSFFFFFLSLSNLTPIREVKGRKAIAFKSLLGTLGCQGRRPPDLHCLWCLENNANKGRVLLLNAGMPSSLAKAQAVPGKHPRKQSPLSKSARKGWRKPLTFRKDYQAVRTVNQKTMLYRWQRSAVRWREFALWDHTDLGENSASIMFCEFDSLTKSNNKD